MRRTLPPITVCVLGLALLVAFFPVALFSGKIETFWSARAAVELGGILLDAAACFGLSAFITVVLLVWPMAFAGYLHEESPWTRALAVGVLWCLPALGFGYFVGEYLSPLQAYDYLVAIAVPVFASSIFFWRSQSWISTAVFLTVALFFGVFLVGDVLGPFPTFVRFTSGSVAVYALRTVLTFSALGVLAFVPVSRSGEAAEAIEPAPTFDSAGTHPSRWVASLAAMGALLTVGRVLLESDGIRFSDLAPFSMFLIAWVLVAPNRFSSRTVRVLCLTQFLALLVPVLRAFTAPSANLWSQLWLGYQTLGVCVMVWLMVWLGTQSVHHPRESRRFS